MKKSKTIINRAYIVKENFCKNAHRKQIQRSASCVRTLSLLLQKFHFLKVSTQFLLKRNRQFDLVGFGQLLSVAKIM